MRTSAGQALMLGTSALQGFYRSAHSVCRIGLLGRHIGSLPEVTQWRDLSTADTAA